MRVSQALNLVRQMGLPWAVSQTAYRIRNHTGWYERRFPLSDWPSVASSDDLLSLVREKSIFFFNADSLSSRREKLKELISADDTAELMKEAEDARRGRFRFFFGEVFETGNPIDWHRHPVTGERWPRAHWSRLSDRVSSDVKWIWEAGRFGFAYTLVRAYWLTKDDSHAETFWQLAESFRRDNPPNAGAHWMCGQECAFRSLALCFALFALLDAPSTTSERARMMIEMLASHGERIEGNIDFAILQKNNHAINEALALWTLGVAFPFLRSSRRWERRGREILEREAARQIYDDGSYIQHSMNYHRLILQSYSWAIRLGEIAGREFSSALRDRVARASLFLYQLTDQSGRASNYGSNDGAMLFRLDSADFSDYRPALALALWVSAGKRVYPAGAWDEPLLWLCGEEPLEKETNPIERASLAAETGGYYTILSGRSSMWRNLTDCARPESETIQGRRKLTACATRPEETWAMIRCCRYRDRPAQSDMLHVDLWWRGANILADPGTYSYNSAPPWNNGLALTSAHNTIAVDDLDQMERGPRFTWFHWNRGKVIGRETAGEIKLFEGEHDGYRRRLGIVHRRAVMLIGESAWVIIDDIRGEGEHKLSSQWLFPKSTIESQTGQCVKLRCAVGDFTASFFTFASDDRTAARGIEIYQGDEDSTLGWFSDRYFRREPALAVITSDHCSLPARRITFILLSQDAAIEGVSSTEIKVSMGDDFFSAQMSAFPYGDEASMILSTKIEKTGRE
jgi:asparagine synthase (glutamine-hydrolysing)